jgi:hypothetical protein
MSLRSTLRKVTAELEDFKARGEEFDYAIIGGLAVGAWGFPRATRDIDLLISSGAPPESLLSFFTRRGYGTELSRHPGDPLPLMIKLQSPGKPGRTVEIDIIVSTRRWETEMVANAHTVRLGQSRIRVARPEDIICLKLRAGGPLDLVDAGELLKVNGETADREYLRKRARQLRVTERLEMLLGEAGSVPGG